MSERYSLQGAAVSVGPDPGVTGDQGWATGPSHWCSGLPTSPSLTWAFTAYEHDRPVDTGNASLVTSVAFELQ